ncbi:MAG: ribonuclease D, partial [Leptospira sp.]|nr:ribonuclease D [Leptospira sp.]
MQINSDYILIDTKQSLDLALINLKSSPVLSIDTESSGYYTYYSRICLIQITAHGKNYLIDTLTNHDLQGIGEIFNNKSILKIFHSATDDIKALKRDFKFEFSAI